ncbi:MAG: hypothetical protein ACJAXX_001348 [Roseivirga sp.]|jgi:hypothetical protein
MKKSENGLTKYLLHKSYLILLSFFTLAIFSACTDDEVNAIEEIQITGGHQVERTDGDFEFKYGLFNTQGQPTTEFNQGDQIIFSFWMTNDTDQSWYLIQSEYRDFFRVYKIEGVDNQIDMGQPHDGMFFQKKLGIGPISKNTLKFELPWVVPASMELDRGLWKKGRNAPPLEKGNYRTVFDQSFEFSDGGQTRETDVLSFSIDFTVN